MTDIIVPDRRKPSWDQNAPKPEDVLEWVQSDQHERVKDAFERFAMPTSNLLHEAQSGSMVDLLVGSGADVNQTYREETPHDLRGADPVTGVRREDRLDTPLQAAVRQGKKEVFDRLMAHGADIDIGDGQRPLMLALGRINQGAKYTDMANDLLDANARVQTEGQEMPALYLAVSARCDALMVKRILDAGADPQEHHSGGAAPLYNVVDAQPGVVDVLMDYGAKPNEPVSETNPDTPLHAAVWRGQPETAERLLKRGADVETLTGSPDWQRFGHGYVHSDNPRVREAAGKVLRFRVEQETQALREAADEVEQAQPVQARPAVRNRPRL